MSGWVEIPETPVYIREVGGCDGEAVVSEEISLLSYTLKYLSLDDVGTLYQVGLR
jgi:hypothetical protein